MRKRGEGELAVRAAFGDALFVRPAVMFGPDDAFLTTILRLLRRLPIYPMFGHNRSDALLAALKIKLEMRTPRHTSPTFASRIDVVIGATHMKRC